jgi:pyruvate dehydrogenase E2 component (dihydrolipoamide acetyltransferase)
MAEEFFIPKLGQTVEEVTLLQWVVQDGDKVEHGQEVLEVETDKTTFMVEANAEGYIHIGPYGEGDVVPVLEVVAIIGDQDDEFVSQALDAGAEQPAETEVSAETQAVSEPALGDGRDGGRNGGHNGGRIFASPRARKLAGEKGVDLAFVSPTGGGGIRVVEQDVLDYLAELPKVTPVAQKMAAEVGLDLREITGTGPGGKITKTDVERALQAVPEPRPAAPAPSVPSVPAALPAVEVLERVPLAGPRRIIAERMATSVHTTARVTLVTEVDATEFVNMRERLKARVTEDWGFAPGYNDLLAKVVATALRQFPYMNARLTADAVEYVAPINMGMAVDTERGLLVPVIRDADKKSLQQFGQEFRAMVDRARQGKALPDDLSGGTFTLTNLGMYDIDAFTPVINLPEAAILGVGRIAPKPVVHEGDLVVRQMMTLSLVFDHRLVDGAPAARFLQYIKELVEEPYLWVTALQNY